MEIIEAEVYWIFGESLERQAEYIKWTGSYRLGSAQRTRRAEIKTEADLTCQAGETEEDGGL
jgi:hypothetical protein